MPYKIEALYVSGWDDAGWTDDDGERTTPVRFPTTDEAQAAIDGIVAAVKAAVASGDMEFEEVRDNYRIAETFE